MFSGASPYSEILIEKNQGFSNYEKFQVEIESKVLYYEINENIQSSIFKQYLAQEKPILIPITT
jgi:hypothetical protein